MHYLRDKFQELLPVAQRYCTNQLHAQYLVTYILTKKITTSNVPYRCIWPFLAAFTIHLVLSWVTLVNGNLPMSFSVTIMFLVDFNTLTACL